MSAAAYAVQIARDWNVGASGQGFAEVIRQFP
jgi:hypothetical protein